MAQRCILSSALRGLKVFPTTSHYGLTLAGCDHGDNKKKQVADIRKLCSGVFPLPLNLLYWESYKARLGEFPNATDRICAIVDGVSPLRHDVFTFSVHSDKDNAASSTAHVAKKLRTIDQCVQTDVTLIQSSDLKCLVDGLNADLQNMCGLELLLDGKVKDAILKFRDAAELGSSSAMYNLGVYYYFWRRTRNVEKAAKYWEMAARLGDVRAMYQVGAMHIRGFLHNSDMNYGVELVKRSAKGGYCDAQFYMGVRALHELDYALAEDYLKRTVHKEENRREMRRWLTIKGVPDEVRTMVNKLLHIQ